MTKRARPGEAVAYGDRTRAAWEHAFGLLEMTIAMAVLGVIMAGAFAMLFRGQLSFDVQQVEANMRQQARTALGVLTTDLRLAGYRLENVPEAIGRAGVNVLQFAGDLDDGAPSAPCDAAFQDAVDGGVERVTYTMAGGNLQRSLECWSGAAWTVEYTGQVVAVGLVGPQALFRFFAADGTEIVPTGPELSAAERAEVRSVAVAMNFLDPDEPLVGTEHRGFNLTGRVRLRNVN